jgi:hypothetical protein
LVTARPSSSSSTSRGAFFFHGCSRLSAKIKLSRFEGRIDPRLQGLRLLGTKIWRVFIDRCLILSGRRRFSIAAPTSPTPTSATTGFWFGSSFILGLAVRLGYLGGQALVDALALDFHGRLKFGRIWLGRPWAGIASLPTGTSAATAAGPITFSTRRPGPARIVVFLGLRQRF